MTILIRILLTARSVALLLGLMLLTPGRVPAQSRLASMKAVLLPISGVHAEALRALKKEGWNGVAIELNGEEAEPARAAARQIVKSGLDCFYWIEVGRCPSLADAHPEWMASLQGHTEWRRYGFDVPRPGSDEVVKNYPWVPIGYKESFEAHLARIKKLLDSMPAPKSIFLNDLQGSPSACGCGHPLCRWTTDYGPIKTATPLGPDAAALFVKSVKKLSPDARVIPVWTTECEEHDQDGLCGGIACFNGACWREFTLQVTPLAAECETIAALLPYRAFQRDLPAYGPTAGWITKALASFSEMPTRYKAAPIPPNRLIAVLQGWDVTPDQEREQIARSTEAGAAGWLVARSRIDQTWKPRLVKVKNPAP